MTRNEAVRALRIDVTTTMTKGRSAGDGEQHARVVDDEGRRSSHSPAELLGGIPEGDEDQMGEEQIEGRSRRAGGCGRGRPDPRPARTTAPAP